MKWNISQPLSQPLCLHFKFSRVSVWLTHLWDIIHYSLSWASVTYQIAQHPQPGCSPSQPLNSSCGQNCTKYPFPKCIFISSRYSWELLVQFFLEAAWLNHFLQQWIHQCNFMTWKSITPFSLLSFTEWSLCSHIVIQEEQKFSTLLFPLQ